MESLRCAEFVSAWTMDGGGRRPGPGLSQSDLALRIPPPPSLPSLARPFPRVIRLRGWTRPPASDTALHQSRGLMSQTLVRKLATKMSVVLLSL